jgi:hypothetical protein
VKQYQILADEGWTHDEIPALRYHHFFASLFAPSDTISLLEQKLQDCDQSFIHQHKNEIKWSKLNGRFFADYKLLIDTFFDFWETHHELKFRQMFMDRKYDYVGDGNPKDMLFMLYYQFIKHSFGFDSDYFKSLAVDTLLFKLDDYSDIQRKKTLIDYVQSHYSDFNVKINFIDSKKSAIHQIIDILMGAAGYYGNFKCCKKEEVKKQDICKLKLAKYIQKRFEQIQSSDRDAKVFHWFENTGGVRGSGYDNRHRYKIMIWKFIPREHRVDLSWEHKKNPEIKSLKQKMKYWTLKQNSDCNMFEGEPS